MTLKFQMKFIFMLTMIFANITTYSQTLQGRIIDSITKKPIELVNITFVKKDLGVNSDINGNFKIKIKDNTDSLQISSVGYKTKIIDLLTFNKTADIELSPKIEKLEEILISNKKKNYTSSKTLGLNKKLKVRTSLPFGYEYCNFIKNPSNKNGKVKSIILSLNKRREFDYLATYNIRFYEYDSINKTPGEELYFENLIVEPQNKTYQLKINIDTLNIKLPKKGICIGVEIINTKYNEEISSMSKIAPNINFTHTTKDILTWIRFRSKNWKIGTHKSQVKDAFVNAMINIEVEIEK